VSDRYFLFPALSQLYLANGVSLLQTMVMCRGVYGHRRLAIYCLRC